MLLSPPGELSSSASSILSAETSDTSTSLLSTSALPAQQSHIPLAVIGWSHKFPGDADTPDGFWNMLCEARTAHGRVPHGRFNVDAFYHPDHERTGSMNIVNAHFLKQDISAFDAPFFSLQPAEAATMDPQQRIMLETAYHAFENAGLSIDNIRGSKTSVYVGSSSHDYESIFARDPENNPKYLGTGIGGSILPNRISWFFDLRGESMLIDTACSSSLTCLHLAAQSLQNRTSNVALVGGVNLMITPDSSFFHLSNMGFFSPESRSFSFDQRGNGYAKGEGSAIVVLKRLDDAVRDGDTIRAVLRATGTNQDGRTPGITQPSEKAQEANIRATHDRHGIDPRDIRYIEAHGTGTQVGDPIECAAIANTLGRTADSPLIVGAVKTNIGHLEAVAGLAGLIKTIMVLEKGLIPPNALYKSPNRKIPLDKWNIEFPTKLIPWPTRGLRRAAVNSFGYGGTNAYAVLDDARHYLEQHQMIAKHSTIEYPSQPYDTGNNNFDDRRSSEVHATDQPTPRVFIWSAADESGIRKVLDSYSQYLDHINVDENSQSDFLENLAYTLSQRRSMLPWKTFLIVDTFESLKAQIALNSSKPVRSSDPPTSVFVFTGQGAQWHAMGRELIQFPQFAQSLRRAELVLEKLESGFVPQQELFREKASSRVNEPLLSQTLCTVIQLALVDLMSEWGVQPKAVIGHSSGEIAAAYCAGGLSFDSAIKTAFYRGYHASTLARQRVKDGSMISVSLNPESIGPYLSEAMASTRGHLVVACENSPNNITVSGDRASIEHLNGMMEQQGIFARQLKVPLAYHSPHMDSIAADYARSLSELQERTDYFESKHCQKLPIMFSTVTGKQAEMKRLSSAEYWVENMVSSVKFTSGLSNLIRFVQADTSIARRLHLLEIGPHAALKRPVKDTLATIPHAKDAVYDSLLERNVSAMNSCLDAVGRMRCHGVSLDLTKVNSPTVQQRDLRQLIGLPQYPFNHSQTYWAESRISRDYRFRHVARHELLGIPSSDWNPLEPHWRHYLKMSENPWMQDHCMDSANIYPAAAMVTMVIEAARQLASPSHNVHGYHIKNIQFMHALKVNTSTEGVEVQLRFHRPKGIGGDTSLEHDFTLFACTDNVKWTQCCAGSIIVETVGEDASVSRYPADSYAVSKLQAQHTARFRSCLHAVNKQEFYASMARYGCQFGPAHQTLENIQYCKMSPDAYGEITLDSWIEKCDMPSSHLSPCVIHPTDLDGILQLSMAALTKGATQPFPTMVPTDCKSLWISNDLLANHGSNARTLEASAHNSFKGFREADFSITAFDKQNSNKALVVIENWRQMSITNLETSVSSDTSTRRLCYSTKWELDIEQMSPETIHKLCDERACGMSPPSTFDMDMMELLSFYFMSSAADSIADGRTPNGFGWHTSHYLDWIHRTFNSSQFQHMLQTVPGGEKLIRDETSRNSLLESLAADHIEHGLTIHVGKHLPALLRGEIEPLEVVYDPAFIRDFYRGASWMRNFDQITAYASLLAHKNPNLKILEIGAGTGSGTLSMLDALAPRASNGLRPKLPKFEQYDFTDISSQHFEHARELLSEYSSRFNFAVLDIEKNPSQQGFIEGSYDVVYAGLVIHATSDVVKSLRNARKLLKPGGKLILLEITNVGCARTQFIFGVLSGWWLSTEEFRNNGPLLTVDGWDTVLRQSGFSGAEIAMPNLDEPGKGTTHVIIATAVDDSANKEVSITAPLIVVNTRSIVQREVAEHLCSLADDITDSSIILSEDLAAAKFSGRNCIVLSELDQPWLKSIDEPGFEMLKALIAEASSVLWATTGTGTAPAKPEHDLVTGLARNIRSEIYTSKFTHLGIDRLLQPKEMAKYIHTVYQKNFHCAVEDYEEVYRIQDGSCYIGRVTESDDLNNTVWSRTTQQKPQPTTLDKEAGRELTLSIGAPGLLDTLHFVDDKQVEGGQLSDNEVEVQTAAVGLNFRDILIAIGKMSNKTFGYEFSGIVTRAGSRSSFKQGDRVFGMTTSGAFKTTVRTHANCVAKMGDHMFFDEAAAMPMAFATAYYCLVTKANLQAGESVLIHSAAGGVGQAAIQIAKHLGATVFVTVGSDEKKRFIMKQYAIPEANIFSSRNAKFADSIMALTHGEGVDVILNSLAGNLMRASWSAIAPLGRFVEIGKTDIMSTRGLQTQEFLKNVSFIAVDLAVVMQKSPTTIARVMKAICKLQQAGHLAVSRPLQCFHVGELETAFRWMQGGKNIGKAVVTFDRAESIMALPSCKAAYVFSSNATYVIAGGFGGIGAAIIKWMASLGARYFLVPSRSGARSSNAQKLITDLNSIDTNIEVVGPSCDIGDSAQVKAMVQQAQANMPPIKGCIQATMLLRDSLFTTMTHQEWHEAIRPKVAGSWNLHKYLPRGLDFFVALSSIASLIGSRGQANYAAGNAYADSLVRHRLAHGERAFGLNIGPVKNVGSVAENGIEDDLLREGFEAIGIDELMILIEYACDPAHGRLDQDLDANTIVTGLGGLRDPKAKQKNEIYWLSRPLFSNLNNYYSEPNASNVENDSIALKVIDIASQLKGHLSDAVASQEIILSALRLKLSRALNISLDDVEASRPIYAFGVDSLVSLEIRYWFMKEVKANLAVFEIMGAATLIDLCAVAWTKSGFRAE